jgi:hypothetical protein
MYSRCDFGYCYQYSTWDDWGRWVALAVIVVVVLLFAFAFSYVLSPLHSFHQITNLSSPDASTTAAEDVVE